MTSATLRPSRSLRTRIRGQEQLRGTFIKIPHPQVVELLGGTPIDFVVLDAEHAVFDRQVIDACILAARAWSLPALVRVPTIDDSMIGAILDMGAQGVFLPHVTSIAHAERGLSAALYHGGSRGLTGSARSGCYGGIAELEAYARQADLETVIVAQLEDAAVLENIQALVQIDRIDAFFIGTADLGLSLANQGSGAEKLDDAIQQLAATVLAGGHTLGTYVPRPEQVREYEALGYRLLTAGSDQTMIRQAAKAIAEY